MKECKDRDGKIIKAGDIISMPHVSEKSIHGYYISKVSYDKKRKKLVTDDGFGFRLAYNVVKLND